MVEFVESSSSAELRERERESGAAQRGRNRQFYLENCTETHGRENKLDTGEDGTNNRTRSSQKIGTDC